MNENRIGLVIMASGLGKRFGGNKLMASLGDRPLIQWILDTTENLFEKRVVVTRSSEVKSLCDSLGIDCILHGFPGRNDTVRLGLSALMDEIDYCFFAPGDEPLIRRKSIQRLIDGAKIHKDKIVRPCYGDAVGAPVGFPKAFFTQLLELPEGKGGGSIVKDNLSLVHAVGVRQEWELWDVDTVEDLDRIKNCLLSYR